MCIEGIVVKRQLMPVSVPQSVTAEYPSIGSYNPEKAGYMDTQLSPANACIQMFTVGWNFGKHFILLPFMFTVRRTILMHNLN